MDKATVQLCTSSNSGLCPSVLSGSRDFPLSHHNVPASIWGFSVKLFLQKASGADLCSAL
jgi:hypothetical protein